MPQTHSQNSDSMEYTDLSLLANPTGQITERLQELYRNNPVIDDLDQSVELPAPLNMRDKHLIASTAFSVVCGIFSVIVYADGSAKDGFKYAAFGIIGNLPQNVWYGYITYDEFRESIQQKRIGRLLGGSFAGMITSTALTLNEYKWSDGSLWKTLSTFLGNVPLNMVGTIKSIARFSDYLHDNVAGRELLRKKLQTAVEPYDDLKELVQAYPAWVHRAGKATGLGLGVIIATSQICWVASVARNFYAYVYPEWVSASTAGFLTTSPSILIAMLISGRDFCTKAAEACYDIGNHFYEKIISDTDTGLFNLSKHEIKFLVLDLIVNALFIYPDMNSSHAAYNAYASNLDASYQNGFLDFSVIRGAALYNTINNLLSIHDVIKNRCIANADVNTQEKHKLIAMKNFIDKASPEKINAFIEKNTSLTAEEKQAVLPAKKPQQTWCQWFTAKLPTRVQQTLSVNAEPTPAPYHKV